MSAEAIIPTGAVSTSVSPERRVWIILAITLAALVVLAFVLPHLAPHPPGQISLRNRLLPPVWFDKGQWAYPLGTDHLGRCVLSRLLYGAQLTWLIAFGAAIVSALFGTFVGVVAGYAGGKTEAIIMRWVEMHVAFPGLLMVLLILTVLGANVVTLIGVLAFNGWMVFAVVTRNAVLVIRKLPYVEVAQAFGAPPWRVIASHIIPNLVPSLITLGVLEYARLTLAEAAISFLGLGVQPPDISWGFDVANGRNYLLNAWWLVTFPGLAIAFTVLGLNLLARWLRRELDPKAR
ncbi:MULTISPECIES: ABC transporter permease [unclassified Chelatococcus]|uniref:ABC transporter permease n=1 Tax=unclassified Chelatococcus TaxID=2638111 RepID=UPI001BCD8CF0|nr:MULTISPECIES: ABC transporter permease [unclassified Chelatococcus]CAH1656118.1 Peptide ABC transporter permease [Hyphomicrobiales bacterium]MBS7742504.1 ABC transporter permease [Chelatococcus sp. HY11]MBX3542378.1 ABC transporter permease [Chelatococcus sp.]MCO5075405.1 ABC transporter permease [Chelatococcus sp.]CAH1695743.1 Peptide ABC transporter permease [Hyphomicrobiales bacterium]